MTVQLGDTARDIVTGFTGVVTGIVDYLTGCNQALMTPRVKEDGTSPEARWVDTDRLEVVDAPRVVINIRRAGADIAAPIR